MDRLRHQRSLEVTGPIDMSSISNYTIIMHGQSGIKKVLCALGIVIAGGAGAAFCGSQDEGHPALPIVLTVHGLLPSKQSCNPVFKTILPRLCTAAAFKRYMSESDPFEQCYFYTAISDLCAGKCGTILPFHWGGDTRDSREAVNELKSAILKAAAGARKEQRPFIILAHSWGTVLAVEALAELDNYGPEERTLLRVDKFVTMGSPLGGRLYAVGLAQIHDQGFYQQLQYPKTVRRWVNYYTPRDFISSRIDLADDNVDLESGSPYAGIQTELEYLHALTTNPEIPQPAGPAAPVAEELKQFTFPFSTLIWHAAYYQAQTLYLESLGPEKTATVDEGTEHAQNYLRP